MTAPMFRAVMSMVTSPGSPWTWTERLVAIAVADQLDLSGNGRWPETRALALYTGLSVRCVQRAIGRLTAPDGVFTRMEAPDGNRFGRLRG